MQAYRTARNAVVELYQEDVSRRLEFERCRGRLHGDVNACLRVFRFLEHWGIINSQAGPAVSVKPPSFLVAPGGVATLQRRYACGGIYPRDIATELCIDDTCSCGAIGRHAAFGGRQCALCRGFVSFQTPYPDRGWSRAPDGRRELGEPLAENRALQTDSHGRSVK